MTEFQEDALAVAERVSAMVELGLYTVLALAFVVALTAGFHLVRSMRS